MAEHIEHARQNGFAHRRFQGTTGVLHRHAACQTLGRRQRYGPDMLRIALCLHFHDDASTGSGRKQRSDRRQLVVKAHVNDAATHRRDNTLTGWPGLFIHVRAIPYRCGARATEP